MRLHGLIISVVMVYSLLANAQNNLVHNPSFEEYTGNCVYIDYNSLTHWYNPDCFGSPDYMHECMDYPNTTSMGVPQNVFGYQWAKEGKAYLHLGWDKQPGTYDGFREYIAQRLKAPLQAGKEYCISIYASLTETSYGWGGSNALGLILSKDSIYADSIYYFNGSWWLWSCNNIYGAPVIGDSTKILDDTLNWVKIEGKYIAKGGEEFLAIGNFYTSNQTRFGYIDNNGYAGSGYYIDMVELFLCEDTVQKPLEPPPASDSSLHYKLPNVISPNADGLNDAFVLESRGVKEVSITLYNRWGEEVLRHKVSGISTDMLTKTILWDVTHKNKPAPQGVYYYIIELSTKTGEVIIENGTVTVL